MRLADLSNPATASLLRCFSLLQPGQKAQPRHSLLLAPAAKLPLPLSAKTVLGRLAAGKEKRERKTALDSQIADLQGLQISHPRVSLVCVIWLCIDQSNQSTNEPPHAASDQLGSTPSYCLSRFTTGYHLPPTCGRPGHDQGTLVASASRACSSLPPAVPPCPPLLLPIPGAVRTSCASESHSLSCLASVSSRRSGQGRPILLPQPVSPRVQSPPPPPTRQEASTTLPFLPRPQQQRNPSTRPRRPHRRPGRYPRARRWP